MKFRYTPEEVAALFEKHGRKPKRFGRFGNTARAACAVEIIALDVTGNPYPGTVLVSEAVGVPTTDGESGVPLLFHITDGFDGSHPSRWIAISDEEKEAYNYGASIARLCGLRE